MKRLSIQRMESIQGGAVSPCAWMAISFGLTIVATFAGPAGILVGAGWFYRGVTAAGDCERSMR